MNRDIPVELVEPAGSSLYASERKIYPREVSGRLQRLRTLAVFVLLGLFYLVPWLRWDGRQAVLFDLPARRFHVLGLEFWPQDFVFLALLLIIAGLALFFFTTLAGRLWCGYACPQTVWTEVFLWIERKTEGSRNQRIKLDAAPWTRDKILRKGGKHLAWLLLALWTGFTFVAFFTPATGLAARLPTLQWGGWETFWVLFYALATWGNAGFLREQVCKYMCPYARFQSAMFDRNTLIIAYDPMRGEPRGPRRRELGSVLQRMRGLLDPATAFGLVAAASARETHPAPGALAAPRLAPEALGDCIDCTICVQVCPTGIDIRNGLQYECIACGACIDACDAVMDKVGYPRGLIAYSTQNQIDGQPTRILRGRVLVYGAVLLALCIGWAWGVGHRNPLIVEVLRDRNALYRSVEGERTENSYAIRLINKDASPRSFQVQLRAPAGIELVGGARTVQAGAGEVLTLPMTVSAPASVPGKQDIVFVVERSDGQSERSVPSTFFGPPP